MKVTYVFCLMTDKKMIDEHANFGLWGDGRGGEEDLSPEEIQMVNHIFY